MNLELIKFWTPIILIGILVYIVFIFVLILILNLIRKPHEDRITFLELNEKVLGAIISGFFDNY